MFNKRLVDFNSDDIPLVVKRTIENLKKRALKSEGLFRVPGSVSEIKELKQKYNNGEDPDLDEYDLNSVASLLKRFLRDLPEPLCTFDLYDIFLASAVINVRESRNMMLKKILGEMPLIHKNLLMELCTFLKEVASFEQYNKMGPDNLSLVFSPNLLRTEDESVSITIEDAPIAKTLMKTFITDYDDLFN
ncbi:gtpase-activating protein bem3 [Anaeramoeba flamelloides]|uniref:Gtpase-activating protein bem3 n=1 Tax=Anaeramoeba flamelloides TaxID=1746091 RepID=A0AAV8AA87_9EUKA|nr:gtpase-activating protein bem3 [Anaeramoeba flamelloides]